MKPSNPGFHITLIKLLIMSLSLLSGTNLALAVEPTMPPPPAEGRLTVTGSVPLSNLVAYWTQSFSVHNPIIKITIVDPGGNAGIAALINGTADMALTGPISPKQEEAFEERFGYKPRMIPVARDAVAVYVNDANPMTSITLQELDAVFSSTYRCGEFRPIRTWGDLGAKGVWAQKKISAYGLTVDMGASSLFREKALCGGDFKRDFQALAGPESVQSALNSDIGGVGFFSSSMQVAGIHPLAVASYKDVHAVALSPDTIRTGQYPLSRTLSIAVNRPINAPLPPPLKAFIHYVLSEEGQRIVTKAGYVSLP